MAAGLQSGKPATVDDTCIRELEEIAHASLSWPARLAWSWHFLLIFFFIAYVVVWKLPGKRTDVVVALVVAYVGIVVAGHGAVALRAYERAWAGAARPEPGRLARRLTYLSLFAAGLTLLAAAAMAVLIPPWLERALLTGLAGIGIGLLSFVISLVWGHLRQQEPWLTALGGSRAYGLGLSSFGYADGSGFSVYQPEPEWTRHDDPKLVAWARALRGIWRNHWIASAPTRYFVHLRDGLRVGLLAHRRDRPQALRALAAALHTQLVARDERVVLDWLDEHGWGPAPHAPAAWPGVRYTLCGAYRDIPVAVSVVHRPGRRRAMPVQRTDIFVALRVPPATIPPEAHARAAQMGYLLWPTAWGLVFSRDAADAAHLVPDVVLELLSSALSTSTAQP